MSSGAPGGPLKSLHFFAALKKRNRREEMTMKIKRYHHIQW